MPSREFTEGQVVRAWSTVADLDTAGANRLQRRTVDAQPELAAFTLALTENLTDAERSVAVFILHCIVAVFKKNSLSVARVTEKDLTRQWPRSRKRVAALATELSTNESGDAYIAAGPQPALLAAVLEALEDVVEGEEAISLADDAYWQLLVVFDTLVVALHERAKPRRAG